MGRGFRLGVDRRGNGIAVKHIGTIKDFQGILLLAKKKTTRSPMDVNTKKVVDVTEITHGEFTVKRGNNAVEHGSGVGSEDYVIDIQK
jgi:hypothetical protein